VFSRSKKSLCGRKKERSCTLTVSHSRSHTHGLTLTVNTHGDAHSQWIFQTCGSIVTGSPMISSRCIKLRAFPL